MLCGRKKHFECKLGIRRHEFHTSFLWLGASLGAQQHQWDPHTAHGQPQVSHTGEVAAAVGKGVQEGLKCLSKSRSCVVTQKQGICRFW